MRLSATARDVPLAQSTRELARRMVSPLCGLDRTVGLILRSRYEPRFAVSGADMTGVHILRGASAPGSYHIGGTGTVMDEVLMRALGETVERYSQFISVVAGRQETVWASHEQLRERGPPLLGAEKLRFFPADRTASPDFRFDGFDPAAPLTWVRAARQPQGEELWVPAQLVLVGYTVQRERGEPFLLPGVTTGTAAHTDPRRAMRNALLELIQIDAAMGHWYSAAVAPRIELDRRTRRLERLIERAFAGVRPLPAFYWLPSADLPGLTVACLIGSPPGKEPAAALGLGIDTRLDAALHRALLEAVGVTQLAKINAVEQRVGAGAASSDGAGPTIDPGAIFDLDSNVVWYARPENSRLLERKLSPTESVPASELPPDSELELERETAHLVEAFGAGGKELVALDLTSDDIAALGFVSVRVWSPDVLSLSLPSAPPTEHPRFAAYGGFANPSPHPYP